MRIIISQHNGYSQIHQDVLLYFCQNSINLKQMEYESGAVYIHIPDLNESGFKSIQQSLQALPIVSTVQKVHLLPAERKQFELDVLLHALPDPVMSVDLTTKIIVANPKCEDVFEEKITHLQNQLLDTFVSNLDLLKILRQRKAHINNLSLMIKGKIYLANIFPIYIPGNDYQSLVGAVILLKSTNRLLAKLSTLEHQHTKQFADFHYQSKSMQTLVKQAQRMAELDAALLISGETGTGKELLARACHQAGQRKSKPFMVLSCGSLPENMAESELFGYAPNAFAGADKAGKLGLLELTANGTLFLDEVAEMSSYLQVKLLRFLQDGVFRRVGSDEEIKVNVRIISSSQKKLSDLCEQNLFREDLYFRLNVLSLTIPCLRDVKEEIIPLAKFFIAKASQQIGRSLPFLSVAAEQKLNIYDWPGNIRQLENTLFNAVSILEGDELLNEHIQLPSDRVGEDVEPSMNLDEACRRFEKQLLQRLYPLYPSTRQLAKRLGVSHTAIANKLRLHAINKI